MEKKKEALAYLKAYRSYLVAMERFKRSCSNQIKVELIMPYIEEGIEVDVKYKGKVITGKIVGYPKDGRECFCLESDQLDVQEKAYSRSHSLHYTETYQAKRKYFPFSAIVGLPKSVKQQLKESESQIVYEPFKFDFKYASEAFIDSLKNTIVTKKDVDRAIAEISPMKVGRYPSPEERYENFQTAIKEGLDWEDPIEFLYDGVPTLGIVGYYPVADNKMIRVYSPSFKPPKYVKYIPKTSFLRWIRNNALKKQLFDQLVELGA